MTFSAEQVQDYMFLAQHVYYKDNNLNLPIENILRDWEVVPVPGEKLLVDQIGILGTQYLCNAPLD